MNSRVTFRQYLGVNDSYKGKKQKEVNLYMKEFCKFLIQNNVYNSFIHYFSTVDDKWSENFHTSNLIDSSIIFRHYVQFAFDWEATKEKDLFWSDLDLKWKSFCNTMWSKLQTKEDKINSKKWIH